MSVSYDVVLATPLPAGLRLWLRFVPSGLAMIDFVPASERLRMPETANAVAACEALAAYFDGTAEEFDAVPLAPAGTPFQRKVWEALRRIPYGTAITYGQLAARIGSGARAVAGACRANPIPIIVPCHRVVAASGPGGYMGALDGFPLTIKEWLNHHEAG